MLWDDEEPLATSWEIVRAQVAARVAAGKRVRFIDSLSPREWRSIIFNALGAAICIALIVWLG